MPKKCEQKAASCQLPFYAASADAGLGPWSKLRQTKTESQNGDTKTATNQNGDMATKK